MPQASNEPFRTSIRCAIYTRQSVTSTDELSSCNVQCEACRDYVASQRSQGWRLIEERFDDNAYSGATLDRPALKRLLDRIRDGDVDLIVVHRFDRLSPSVLGCATLLRHLREHHVLFGDN